MANEVQITINVTDVNSAETVQQIVTQLNALGPAGAAGGAEAAAGLDQVGEHALTSLDNVRLLRDDLGIRIPRSMEKAIASSQLLSGAIGGIGGGLLAIGAVEIFERMGESIYNAYEKYIDINGAQKEFFDTMQKNKDADFINVHSIETATLRLNQATEAVGNLQNAAKASSNAGWLELLTSGGNTAQMGNGLADLLTGRNLAGASAKAAGQTQELSPEQQSLMHQLNQATIEAAHSGDTALQGQAKITAELQKQLEIDREMQRYTAIQDREKGNPGGSDSGKSLQLAQDSAARAKASAEMIELKRTETDQIIEMQNQATNAGLEGNALLDAQIGQQIDAIARKYHEGEISKQTASAETAAVVKKAYEDQLKQQEQLDQQTQKMADDAAQAGLKGIALIRAQENTQLDSINAAEKKAVGPGGTETEGQSADFNSQRVSAAQMADQRMMESNEQFQERIRQLTDATNDYMEQGYAKIQGETQRHLDTLTKDYEEQYGSDQSAWTGYQAALTQIQNNADRERQQLHAKTMEQLTKEEEQAARLTLPEWQQSMLAIEDQYKDRLRQIQADVKQHVMTEQEGAAAVTAAWQVEQAQMQKNAEQTRDKLASTLSSFFNNPEQYIEKRSMDMAFQMMANQMMQYFQKGGAGSNILQWMFGMGPEMSTSTNPMTDIKSLLGGTAHGVSSMSSGAVLTSAGTTLVTAGTALNTAAFALNSAASSLSLGGGLGAGSSLTTGIGGMGVSGDLSGGMSGGMAGGGSSIQSFGGDSGSDYNFGGPSMVAGGAAGDYSTSVGDGSMMSGSQIGAAGSTAGGATSKIMGGVGGAITAGMGIYSAYENSNPLSGAIAGAMGGAEIGGMFGPEGMLIGAAIGGIAGLFAGIFGDQGKGKAQDYDKNTVQPEIAKDLQDFNAGRSGYDQVSKDLATLQTSAHTQTAQWGSGARSWYSNHIETEINAAIATILKEEKGGRAAVTMSAAQYHTGGWINDFGDFGTSGNEGFIHAMQGEFMVHSAAAQAHGPLLGAIQSGNVSYSNSVQPRMPAGGSGSVVNLTVQALDSKSVAQWAKGGGGRTLVAALNQAQRQYSGVGRG